MYEFIDPGNRFRALINLDSVTYVLHYTDTDSVTFLFGHDDSYTIYCGDTAAAQLEYLAVQKAAGG